MAWRLATKRILGVTLAIGLGAMSGCANGTSWSPAKLAAPWTHQESAHPKMLADTLFEKKKRMDAAVAAAKLGPAEEQEKVATALSEIIRRDSILLLRLHAVNLAGQLNCPTSIQALSLASTDPASDVRIAAVKAWESLPAETSIGKLQEIVGSDTNVDVRLAATRALGSFSGPQAVSAIGLALNDPDPALRLRATESLEIASGKSLGRDVKAWQNYLAGLPDASSGSTRVAEQGTASTFR